MRRTWARLESPVLGFVGLLLVILLWDAMTRFQIMDEFLIGSPLGALEAMREQFAAGTLLDDIAASGVSFGIALSAAIVLGIPLGMLAAWYRPIEYAFDPFFWFFYSAPKLAFYPLFIIWIGLGRPTVIALGFLFAIFPIYESAFTGVRQTHRAYLLAGRSFGATDLDLFRYIALPASVPSLIAGLRLGMGRCLVGVVIGELFGGNAGLGFRMETVAARLRTDDYFAIVLVVAAFGVVANASIRRLEVWAERRRAE